MDKGTEENIIFSNEFRNFISSNPPSVVSKGSSALAIIITLLLSLTYFIKYSETIPVKAEVSSKNYPKPINSKVSGRLIKIVKSDGNKVNSGDDIAYIESTGDYREIIRLLDFFKQRDGNYALQKEEITALTFRNLGDLQQKFEELKSLILDNQTEFDIRRTLQVNRKELYMTGKMDSNTYEDSKVAKEELRISEDEYNKNKKLFKNGVISNLELSQSEARYLAKKHPLLTLNYNYLSNSKQRLSYEKEIINGEKTINEYKLLIREKLNDLKNALNLWHKNFVITCPTDGILRYNRQVQENDYISPSDPFFFVESNNYSYGITIDVPQRNFGKVRTGQMVNIKLDGYPYEEFGKLQGEITYISRISILDRDHGTSYFLAQVKIKGHKSTQNKKIILTNGMTGTGEIIAQKERLISHLMHSFLRLTN